MKAAEASLREQLGQLMVIGFEGAEVDEPVRSLLAHFRPAGVILFTRNLVNPEQTRRLTAELQSAAKEMGIAPLLVGIDHEGGAIVRMGPPVTAFSGNLALAATGSLHLARRQAEAMAEELLALGFNWNFAPCVDVNFNANNPVIGARSFGDDAGRVAEFGAVMVEGFQSKGLTACAKHFPGHGDTEVDSHLGLPSVLRPMKSLKEVELVPFRAAVQAGVGSIMTAHVVFSALEPKRPATVSRKIITGLLREEMGFDGVVISDALEMAGLADSIGIAEGAVAGINAGGDLLLACNDRSVQEEALLALQQAFDSGRIAPERISQALERTSALKKRFITQPSDISISRVGCREHQELEAQIAAASMTLVRNEPGLIPITGGSISVRCAGLEEAELAPLLEMLGRKCAVVRDPEEAKIHLLVTRDLHRRKEVIAGLRRIFDDRPGTILLSVGYPGDIGFFPKARTALAAYSARPASLLAAAEVLLGRAPAPGRLPLKA